MEQERDIEGAVLDAALIHVAFDGWSEATVRAAISDSGVEAALARALFPRGAVDLALAYHRRGDREMTERLAPGELAAMRYSQRVATLIRQRLEVADKEAVRRGMTLFALPMHAADGVRALWGTSDAIWQALGDTSDDLSWYTKRATLSAVYGSAVLFWLGDDSSGHKATWDFVARRIDNVMQVEKVKAAVRENPLGRALMAGPTWLAGMVRAPKPDPDLPGRMADKV